MPSVDLFKDGPKITFLKLQLIDTACDVYVFDPLRGVETYLKPEGRRLGSLLSAVTPSAGMAETDDLLMAPTAVPTATAAPVVKPRSEPVVPATVTAAPAAPAVWSPSNTFAPMGLNIGVPRRLLVAGRRPRTYL